MPGFPWRAAGSLLAALFCVGCDDQLEPLERKPVSIAVHGTTFEVVDSKGQRWNSRGLVGSVLTVPLGKSDARIRIDSVSSNVGGPTEVVLHQFSVASSDGTWRPLCNPALDGRRTGFPLRGRWTEKGLLRESGPTEFEIVCAAGAQGKCILLGYLPWRRFPNGTTGFEIFNACVRMIRADYAGVGKSMTMNGTPITVSDKFGIQTGALNAPPFEAGWSAAGAVCVHHPRVREHTSLKQIEENAPRLKGLTGRVCTREKAEALGALIFNGSRA